MTQQVATSQHFSHSTTTASPTVPSCLPGDLLLAFAGSRDQVTAAPGWDLSHPLAGDEAQATILTRVAQEGDAGTPYQVGFSGSSIRFIETISLRDVTSWDVVYQERGGTTGRTLTAATAEWPVSVVLGDLLLSYAFAQGVGLDQYPWMDYDPYSTRFNEESGASYFGGTEVVRRDPGEPTRAFALPARSGHALYCVAFPAPLPEPATTHLPPLRQWPPTPGGFGSSSHRRLWPPDRTLDTP